MLLLSFLLFSQTFATGQEEAVGRGQRSCASSQVKFYYTGYGAVCYGTGKKERVQSTGSAISTITVPGGCSVSLYTMPRALGSNQKLEARGPRAKTFAGEIQGKYKKAGGVRAVMVRCGGRADQEKAVGESSSLSSSSSSSEDEVGRQYNPRTWFPERYRNEEENTEDEVGRRYDPRVYFPERYRNQEAGVGTVSAGSTTGLKVLYKKDNADGPSTIVQAFALVGLLTSVYGAARHFLQK